MIVIVSACLLHLTMFIIEYNSFCTSMEKIALFYFYHVVLMSIFSFT